MPGAVRQGDITSGHSPCFKPQRPASFSSNVFIDGKPAVRCGDFTEGHCCTCGDGHECHIGVYLGSSSVIINGSPGQKIGDSTSCGCTTIAGSSTVFIEG